MDGVGDVVSILREKSKDKEDNPFKDVVSSSDFSEIYLFLIMTSTTGIIRWRSLT